MNFLKRGLIYTPRFLNRGFKTIPTQKDLTVKKEQPKLPLKERIKHEINHYWTGTKTLGNNILVSRKLIKRMINQDHLHWREERLLRQTTKDVLKVVPFAALLMLPLSEFFIPVIVKFVPGILPSIYEAKDQRMSKLKKTWSNRLQVANLFQKSIREIMIVKIKEDDVKIKSIVEKINNSHYLENQEIILLQDILGNKFKISKLNRRQLQEISSFFNLSVYGPDYYLRTRLQKYLDQIQSEDRKISLDEVSDISLPLLIKLNTERGMRVVDRTQEQLRKQLIDWLELSSSDVPPFLLLISRSFNFLGEHVTITESEIKESIEPKEKIENVKEELKTIERDIKKEEVVDDDVDQTLSILLNETQKEEDVNQQLEEILSEDLKVEKMNRVPEKIVSHKLEDEIRQTIPDAKK